MPPKMPPLKFPLLRSRNSFFQFFKPVQDDGRVKRLLGGKLEMLNLPCQLRHKVSLILKT
jgi:hypothetical protein